MFNGTELLNQTWNTTFFPYIHLMGSAWMLIPLLFIGGALFVKTRDTAVLGTYMMVAGILLTATGSFTGIGSGTVIFMIFAALGFAVLFYNLFYGGKS